MTKANGIALILNPTAANGRLGAHRSRVREAIHDAVGPHSVHFTEGPGHATELAWELLSDGHATLIAAGGDGTINEVVNGFFVDGVPVCEDAALGLFPYGTGSDLARLLGIRHTRDALDRLRRGNPRTVDVGRAEFTMMTGAPTSRLFINIADFGAGGEVVARVNRSSKRFGGFATFLRAMVTTLASWRNKEVKLSLDGEPYEGPIADVIVANGQYYGGGIHVAPDARLDNGLLDVYIIGDVRRREAFINLPRLYKGRLLELKDKVLFRRIRRIDAESKEEVLLNLDGEQPGRLPARLEVLPHKMKIMC